MSVDPNLIDKYVKVTDKIYAIVYATYENGYMTTAGFLEFVKPEEPKGVVPVIYVSEAALELPVNWHDMYVLDDRANLQKISSIDFHLAQECAEQHKPATRPAYKMADGSLSKYVIIKGGRND